MKKYLMFVLVALGLVFAASCQDENVVEGNQPKRISIEASKCLDSRTVVAGDGTVTWSSGDRLLVFGDNISGILTLEKNDVGKPIGTFTGFVDGDPTKLKHAVYGNSSFWNNQVSLQYNKYIYPNSNSPMVGDIANGNVNLEHLFGMVRLQIINMPKTESELIIKGSGIGGTLHWNGNFFEMEYSEDEIKITIPAGKRNGMMTVDVPVYVSKSSDNLTVSLNGVPYKKAGETKQETAVKTTLKTGALNVTSMPKMEWTADGRLTESTGWGEDVEGEDKLESESDGSYLIMDAEDLARFASEVNAGNKFEGKTVKLGKDIDLMDKEWTPIGTSSEKTFHGTFDGQNHIISNLTINGEGKSDQGLFGMTKNGEIKNLTVNNAKVSGRLNVGVVAGTPYTSKYTNIKVTGHVEVNGFAYVGAVGGKNAYANWENITVNVDETSYVNANSVENGLAYRTYVGGVVGFNGEGGHSFKNITSNIDVKGSTIDVGGLFGIAHYGNQFENCVCTGDVEIYAATEAEEAEEIGGIAGVWHNENGTTVTFTNCSFTGEVRTNIERGTVWYNNLVGKPYKSTGKGKLKINGSEVIANGVSLNNDGEYLISNAYGMFWFAKEVNESKNAFIGKTVKLVADIDLTNAAWTPIGQTGATTFNGVFDGQDFTISDLNIDSDAQTGKNYSSGLFGWVETHTEGCGIIKNVKIDGANIKGHHNCGALVGYITEKYAIVENCHVAYATISCTYANGDAAGDKAGALIGNATVATTVKNCTASNSTVSAGRDSGQVIGAGKEANVTGCSATKVTVTANGTGTGANVRNEVIGLLL